MFKPVLVWYIGECTVSIININNGIKDPTCGYQNCNTSQILIFSGQDKRIFVYPSYYLGQYHSKPYYGMKVLALYVDLKGIKNTYTVKYP